MPIRLESSAFGTELCPAISVAAPFFLRPGRRFRLVHDAVGIKRIEEPGPIHPISSVEDSMRVFHHFPRDQQLAFLRVYQCQEIMGLAHRSASCVACR
jgi:hypothetical protein